LMRCTGTPRSRRCSHTPTPAASRASRRRDLRRVTFENGHPEPGAAREHGRRKARHASADNRDTDVQMAVERNVVVRDQPSSAAWCPGARGSSSGTMPALERHVAETAPDGVAAVANLASGVEGAKVDGVRKSLTLLS
jgi:hypothetical protein